MSVLVAFIAGTAIHRRCRQLKSEPKKTAQELAAELVGVAVHPRGGGAVRLTARVDRVRSDLNRGYGHVNPLSRDWHVEGDRANKYVNVRYIIERAADREGLLRLRNWIQSIDSSEVAVKSDFLDLIKLADDRLRLYSVL